MKFYESNRRYVECDCCGGEILDDDVYLKLTNGKYCMNCFQSALDECRTLADKKDIGDYTTDARRIVGGKLYYVNEGDWYYEKQMNFFRKYMKTMQLSDYPDEVKEIE